MPLYRSPGWELAGARDAAFAVIPYMLDAF
jgi:hypothetical protein